MPIRDKINAMRGESASQASTENIQSQKYEGLKSKNGKNMENIDTANRQKLATIVDQDASLDET